MAGLLTAPSALFPTYCFDPEKPILRWSGSYGQRNTIYNNVDLFLGRYIAQDLLISEDNNRMVLSAHVDTLASLPSVIAADFIPPADAVRQEITGSVDVEQSIMNGRLVKKVYPKYPESEKQNRVEGKVDIQAEIGEDGRIHETVVLAAPDPGLAIAAMLAVHEWQYQPYLLNGKPVRVNTQLHVIFRLGN